MTDVADMTLDELRAALASHLAPNAAFDGWNAKAVESAAGTIGADRHVARLAVPGDAVGMIDLWFADIDRGMAAALPPEMLATMKIRARITALVEARLDLLARNREALRRAVAILAMPQNAPRAAKLGWRSADAMWRLAGDTATDYNHYTKRGLLAGIYAATIAVFLNDDSEGHAETRAFLARRIDNIMQFENTKAKLVGNGDHRFSVSRFVGRLRYHAR
ncbi:COQ9 family protein [Sphingomonas turrisvirgatae]|uniref:RpsU-divergently transcribed n=1 Tax=Sphingomonas turrisvirgatae TaxID=1888892 RepID=A0A1E3LYX4_9SPHN|nr:COQ9 family protein [Sphingomonas turrisvirgatae]ODP38986.1 RpsU-divergently transcribed [Sphingomonas turrisvirgatae]